MFHILKKITFSFLLGGILTIFIIQNQNDFKLSLKNKIREISQQLLDCKLDFNIKNINLFFPAITLENVTVSPNKNLGDWDWKCKSIVIKCSWLDYLLNKKFKADFNLINFEAVSKIVDKNVAILPHIKKLILGTSSQFPLSIKKLNLYKSKIYFYEDKLSLKTFFEFFGELKQIDKLLKIRFYLTNGEVKKEEINYSSEINGKIQINIPINENHKFLIDLNGTCILPMLKNENNKCYFIGTWQENNKFFQLNTIDGTLKLGPIKLFNENEEQKVDFLLETPISYIQNFINLPINNINGNCLLRFKTNLKQETADGIFHLKNLSWHLFKQKINDLKIKFIKKFNNYSGEVSISKKDNFDLKGNYNLNLSDLTGSLKIYNESIIDISKENNWLINPNNINLEFIFNKDFKIYSKYLLKISNTQIQKEISSKGSFDYYKNLLKGNGNFNNQNFNLESQIFPEILIKKFLYFNDDNKLAFNINSELNNHKIVINFENIKNSLSEIFKQNLIGSGKIILIGKYIDKKYIGKIESQDLNISISNTYNIIKKINGSFKIDFLNKEILINDLNIKLYKGEIYCKKAIIILSDFAKLFQIKYINFPLTIKNCFLNWKQDIFTTISGQICLQKLIEEIIFKLNGSIIIDDANIKNNIFSNEFNKSISNNIFNFKNTKSENLEINLLISNQNPIKIITPLLKTKINISLNLKKDILNPEISGIVNLSGGSISFPYKNLNIINGNLNFLSNQLFDPIINLIAKNKIKKWNITLNVTGTAQNQIMKFESSPPLSEEQITLLLLVGSPNISMNTIVPSLIMNNLTNIISGSLETQTKIKKYFDKFLKPMKYIRFIPSFNDESGRNGFKGAIEIDDNNRLHASIEKSFNLIEDTKFEVNYTLTDDISLRGIKDQRGDLGGEVEVKWKF